VTAWSRPERLVSVGSIVADIRVEVPRLPPRGGDVVGSATSISAGGAFNVLAASARNGLPSAFGGRHGTGPYGTRIRAELEGEGIATLLAPSPEGDSGFCLVMVEPDGERTFVTSPGVEARIGERKLASLALQPSDVIFVSGYDLSYPELGREIAGWTRSSEADLLLVVDPGPLVAEIPADILDGTLSRARIVTLNRREAGLLAGAPDLESTGKAVLPRLRADALLVIRDGPEGCFLFGADLRAPVHVPAPPVRMLDSTGAGDAHTGVFIAAIAKGLDLISAARRANAAAAISVTRRGPATAPAREELDAFLTTWPQRDPRSRANPRSYEPATIDNRESEP
jgi:sugar/nucleoside kinase (ribokinase family)